MKNFNLWLGIGGSLLITLPVQAQKKTKEKQPNVIFIIADDLGYGGFNKYPITLFFIYRTLCLA